MAKGTFAYYGGAGGGFTPTCAASTAFLNELNSLGALPDAARQQLYDDLICGLDSDGILASIDIFQMYAAHSTTAASVSLVNPTRAKATENNSPIHTVDRGYKTDVGRTAYINTQWSTTEGGNSYAATDAFAGVYIRAWTNDNAARAFGKDDGGNTGLKMNPRNALNQINGQINNTNTRSRTISGSTGLLVFDRLGSVENVLRNGTNEVALGTAGGVLNGGDVYVLGNNSGGTPASIQHPDSEVACFIAGEHLTNAQHATLFTRIETYLDAIGAGVIP